MVRVVTAFAKIHHPGIASRRLTAAHRKNTIKITQIRSIGSTVVIKTLSFQL